MSQERWRLRAAMLLYIAEGARALYAERYERDQHNETRRARRRLWTQPYLRRRETYSLNRGIFLELALEDPDRFRRCLRLDESMFEELLEKVMPLIERTDTNMRNSIPPAERLSLTLRYLATGETEESLQANFRISQSTISRIIRETCNAILSVFSPEFLRLPCSAGEWNNIASRYEIRWAFPHCIGAIDGKHIRIQAPTDAGSLYYNYKDYHSIVLLAAFDADLRIVSYDVGINGRISNSGIWAECQLRRALVDGAISLPPPEPITEGGPDLPYVFIADDGLPLNDYMLVPYPQRDLVNNDARRIYNYRLSRALMTPENGFGVLSSRFMIFASVLRCDPDESRRRVKACLALHNWLLSNRLGRAMYAPTVFVDHENPSNGDIVRGEWRVDTANLDNIRGNRNSGGNRRSRSALNIRNHFCEYFNSDAGSIPQQHRALHRNRRM